MVSEQVQALVNALVADGILPENAPNVDNEIDIETIAYDFTDCDGGFSHRLARSMGA